MSVGRAPLDDSLASPSSSMSPAVTGCPSVSNTSPRAWLTCTGGWLVRASSRSAAVLEASTINVDTTSGVSNCSITCVCSAGMAGERNPLARVRAAANSFSWTVPDSVRPSAVRASSAIASNSGLLTLTSNCAPVAESATPGISRAVAACSDCGMPPSARRRRTSTSWRSSSAIWRSRTPGSSTRTSGTARAASSRTSRVRMAESYETARGEMSVQGTRSPMWSRAPAGNQGNSTAPSAIAVTSPNAIAVDCEYPVAATACARGTRAVTAPPAAPVQARSRGNPRRAP